MCAQRIPLLSRCPRLCKPGSDWCAAAASTSERTAELTAEDEVPQVLDPSGHGAGLGVPAGRLDGLSDRRLHPADTGRSLGRDPLRREVVADTWGLRLPDAPGRRLREESLELGLPARISDRGALSATALAALLACPLAARSSILAAIFLSRSSRVLRAGLPLRPVVARVASNHLRLARRPGGVQDHGVHNAELHPSQFAGEGVAGQHRWFGSLDLRNDMDDQVSIRPISMIRISEIRLQGLDLKQNNAP